MDATQDARTMTTEPITLWFNAACSKCRAAAQMLEERGVAFSRREYLVEAPTRHELDALLLALGTSDPRDLMRTGDERYVTAGLQDAGAERLLDALTTEPGLLQRPIAVRGGKAVVARPPERVLDLLG